MWSMSWSWTPILAAASRAIGVVVMKVKVVLTRLWAGGVRLVFKLVDNLVDLVGRSFVEAWVVACCRLVVRVVLVVFARVACRAAAVARFDIGRVGLGQLCVCLPVTCAGAAVDSRCATSGAARASVGDSGRSTHQEPPPRG